jgi:hypothetical protein
LDEEALVARLNMIAEEIRQEDNLIGQRMSWLVMSQSFLFGTFVTLLPQGAVVNVATGVVRLLHFLIPLVGVLLSLLVLVAMGAASYALAQWRAERDRICEMPEARQLDWPRLKKGKIVSLFGQLLPIAVSVGFALAWLAILITLDVV